MIARRLRWTGLIFLLVTLAGCQMAVVPEHPIDWTWSTRAGDYIRARPAFADDAVYIGSDDNSMHAVASDTGEPLWTFETADNVTSAAAVDDEGVYFGSWDGAVYALDAAGHARWRHQTDGWVSASPLLIDGVLYIGSQDGNFYALDAQTGDL